MVVFWFPVKKCLGEIGCGHPSVKGFDSNEQKADLETAIESSREFGRKVYI